MKNNFKAKQTIFFFSGCRKLINTKLIMNSLENRSCIEVSYPFMPRRIVEVVQRFPFVTHYNKPATSSKILWKWPTFIFGECLYTKKKFVMTYLVSTSVNIPVSKTLDQI